ncbi:MAG: GTPase HflX [Thermoguttaceae bacterium]|nr:GTPase HflX [Thermoguttaceae bacterium]MDW8079548.1 GTPase HflX [Thermoguttaceae bacterium]
MRDRARLGTPELERAVLVGVYLPDRPPEDPPLAELEGLAEAAGVQVVGKLVQRRQAPDPTYYLGKGKVQELGELVIQSKAETVIFDNDLTAAQTRNLENVLKRKVIDRTELILDIFATRARTHEARIAVELAQLEYTRPRLRRMWTHLERLRRGVGLRGPGEKQLEVDRRLIDKRIHELRRELAIIERRKKREVAARREWFTISLVGYTNTGKSTLLNKLTGANVFVHDMLFATLDTRTRRWYIPGWGMVLLSDTVGFIRDLPHHLVASFRATLEEARQADLLLHVADAAHPQVLEQIKAAYRVLEEIGIERKDTILVLNKIDLLEDRSRLDAILNVYPAAIPISAHTGEGMDRLTEAVREALGRLMVELEVETSIANGRLLSFLAVNSEVLSREFHDSVVRVHCRIAAQHLGLVRHLGGTVLNQDPPPDNPEEAWEPPAVAHEVP